MAEPISARSLSVEIAGKQVCRDLEFAARAGECWAILGINGAGKTTLLHTLAGLRPPSAGELFLGGVPLRTLTRKQVARRVGLLPQTSEDPFPSTLLDTALIGRHPYLRRLEWESAEDQSIARRALAEVGLSGLDDRLAHTLSGGERRLLALATLLTQDPPLFLLDEPSNHLDLHQQIAVLELLKTRVRADGKAMMMSVHDVNLAARYCDHVLLLFGDGTLVQGLTSEVLNQAGLERLYQHPIVSVAGPQGPAFLPG